MPDQVDLAGNARLMQRSAEMESAAQPYIIQGGRVGPHPFAYCQLQIQGDIKVALRRIGNARHVQGHVFKHQPTGQEGFAILSRQGDLAVQRTLEIFMPDAEAVQNQFGLIAGQPFFAVQFCDARQQKTAATHGSGKTGHVHFIIFEPNINPQLLQRVGQGLQFERAIGYDKGSAEDRFRPSAADRHLTFRLAERPLHFRGQ